MNRILFDQERETRLYGERKFAEGEAVGALNAYKMMLKKGKMTLEDILSMVNLSQEEIAALQS